MFSTTYGGHPNMVTYFGSFSPIAAGAATTNQMLVAGYTPAAVGAAGQQLGAVSAAGQTSVALQTVSVAANVNYATIGWVGVATNVNSPNIYTLRFCGSATGNICQAQADLIPAPASSTTIATSAVNTAAVLGMDCINRLLYIGVVTQAAGSLTNSSAGDLVNFVLTFTDSNSP
jgi:hypothetical protein